MKKIFIVFIIFPLLCSAQVQQIKPVDYSEIENIKESLKQFKKVNRYSQLALITGGALYTIGALNHTKNIELFNVLTVSGAISSLVGGLLYLKSYNALNLNPKPTKTRIEERLPEKQASSSLSINETIMFYDEVSRYYVPGTVIDIMPDSATIQYKNLLNKTKFTNVSLDKIRKK